MQDLRSRHGIRSGSRLPGGVDEALERGIEWVHYTAAGLISGAHGRMLQKRIARERIQRCDTSINLAIAPTRGIR